MLGTINALRLFSRKRAPHGEMRIGDEMRDVAGLINLLHGKGNVLN